MNLLGVDVPAWVLDWTGSLCVVVSLVYLFEKRMAYWHWSNASLVPYFLLFVSGGQYMLAGLQVSYLVFGVHGLLLWRLERRRRAGGRPFNAVAWYRAGWALTLAIFAYTVALSDFVDAWAGLQFTIVSLALVANWATTRTWTWSWGAVDDRQRVAGDLLRPRRAVGPVRPPIRPLRHVGARLEGMATCRRTTPSAGQWGSAR